MAAAPEQFRGNRDSGARVLLYREPVLCFTAGISTLHMSIMGRPLSLAILAVYLLFAVGVNVLIHTCGGDRTSEFMPISAEDPCGCTDMGSGDACCTLSLRSFQIDDEQNGASRTVAAPLASVGTLLPIDDQFPSVDPALRPNVTDSPPPPRISPILLGCALLI